MHRNARHCRMIAVAAGLLVAALAIVSQLPASRPLAQPPGRPTAPPRQDVHGDPLPIGAMSRMGTMRLRHGSRVTAVAFDPNGKQVYSAGPDDLLVCAWDVATGRAVRTLGGVGGISCLALSSDGRRLVTGAPDNTVRVWDTVAGAELFSLPAPVRVPLEGRRWNVTQGVVCVRLSRDGNTLVTAYAEAQAIVVWDVEKRMEKRRIPLGSVSAHAFDISGNGRALVSVKESAVLVYDLTNEGQPRQLQGHTDQATDVALSPDGSIAVSFGQEQILRWWDVRGGKELGSARAAGFQAALAFAPDGRTLAFAHDDGNGGAVELWDVGRREVVRKLDDILPGITALAFSPDGTILATGAGGGEGHAGAIRLWDVATGKEVRPPAAHPGAVTTVAITADGRLAATCCASERIVRVWDVASGRELRRLQGHTVGVDEVQFSPDGRLLAASAWDHPIVIWAVETGQTVQTLKDHASLGPHMRFSPDGKTLATSGRAASAGIWDVTTGKLAQELTTPAGGVGAMLGYADGRVLALERIETDNAERAPFALWDLAAGRPIRRFAGHKQEVNSVVLSPDGRALASRGDDKVVRVWELATGAERLKIEDAGEESHWTGTQFLAFTPDGRHLAGAGAAEPFVQLWRLPSGTHRAALSGHRGWIGAIEISVNGRILLSGSQDSSTLAWDLSNHVGRRERGGDDSATWVASWDALKDADAARAYRAAHVLASAGDGGVALLRDRLRPAAPADERAIARWVGELDHPQFPVRERATAQLIEVADQAEASLRAALARNASAEVRERVRRILESALEGESAPERLRQVRAVEVLEWLGSAAARRLLDDLARGAEGATLTREARASLRRLAARPVES